MPRCIIMTHSSLWVGDCMPLEQLVAFIHALVVSTCRQGSFQLSAVDGLKEQRCALFTWVQAIGPIWMCRGPSIFFHGALEAGESQIHVSCISGFV